MPGFRWLAGSLLLGLSIYIFLANIAMVCRFILRHEHHSLVPLVGGLLGMAGLLILPVPVMHRWFWLPFVADSWSIICLVAAVYAITKKVFRL